MAAFQVDKTRAFYHRPRGPPNSPEARPLAAIRTIWRIAPACR
jgi:hypothetical protein